MSTHQTPLSNCKTFSENFIQFGARDLIKSIHSSAIYRMNTMCSGYQNYLGLMIQNFYIYNVRLTYELILDFHDA